MTNRSRTSADSSRHAAGPRVKWIAPILAAVMLCCIAAMRLSLQRIPGNPQAYHDAVRQAADQMPVNIGTWIGTDEPIPPAAVTLLKPNVIVCRRFTNSVGGSAELLLVQCHDPRDLEGHYPPVCYPSQGWIQQSQFRRRWTMTQRKIDGMEYFFSREAGATTTQICVADFMLLPNNATAPDMSGVTRFCKDRRLRPYGAAELQILVDARLGQDEREAIYRELLDANHDVLEHILQGVKP